LDPEEAIEAKIEPTLSDTLGPTVAKSLLTRATLAYVTAVGGKAQRYRALVESICSDERVIQTWAEVGAAKQANEWKNLVTLEPQTVVLLTHNASSDEAPR
jgi:hypothetical protein